MKTRIALIIGILAFANGTSALACGGNCYRGPVHHPAIHQHVNLYNIHGLRVRPVPPRIGPQRTESVPLPSPTVAPAPTNVPQQKIPVAPAPTTPEQQIPSAQTPSSPAAPAPAPAASSETTAPKANNDPSNPFANLDTQTLLKISGVKQILEGRN